MTIEEILSDCLLELKDELFFMKNDFLHKKSPLIVKTEKIFYNIDGLSMFHKLPTKLNKIRVEYDNFHINRGTDLHTYFEIDKLKKRNKSKGWYDGFRTGIIFDNRDLPLGVCDFSSKDFIELIEEVINLTNSVTEYELDMTTKIVRNWYGNERSYIFILTLNTTQPNFFMSSNNIQL